MNDLTLSGVLDYQASQQHRFNLGLGYSWYDFKYQQSFNRTLGVDYGSKPGELALFLEDRWFADDLTTLRTGLRYRFIDDGDRSLLEPRISFSRRVRPDLRLKLGGGIYNQYLQLVATEGFSAGDFYLPIDESAKMGRSYQLVLGADWEPTERDLISLEVYTTDLKDLVEFDNQAVADETTSPPRSFSSPGARVMPGASSCFSATVGTAGPAGWVTPWVGPTEIFAELNGGEAFPPKYDRRHDLNALLAYQAGKWKLAASFRYATGQAYTPAAARYYLEDPASGGSNDSCPGAFGGAQQRAAAVLPSPRCERPPPVWPVRPAGRGGHRGFQHLQPTQRMVCPVRYR